MKRLLSTIVSVLLLGAPLTMAQNYNVWVTTEGAGLQLSSGNPNMMPPPPPPPPPHPIKHQKKLRKAAKKHHKAAMKNYKAREKYFKKARKNH